ncbi:SAM-dependent methyltransferase [Gammaproteobacteria bacterium AB-CW1]|uniref:SAM-dependent methyltransferase n=1 Tax=Natronospira elongata TaxID=3110268 RepID=A0AAP6MM31_9GAMM|nr:SAM-dependent methyltransferase [Gammaproteobacteria bacterium AB-CW1]
MSCGELVVVGSGIQSGRHLSRRVISELDRADDVLAMTDSWAWSWLRRQRPDARSLSHFYAEGKDRRQTYREMTREILAPLMSGRRVCAVFYGHPGVFADVPHAAIRAARAAGHRARMEPGVSAEACLYADLGLDPGRRGVQSFEATQFLVFERELDPAALLILWQVALAGDLSCTRTGADPARLRVLKDKLLRWYAPDTEAILYEAARLSLETYRAERLSLRALPEAAYRDYTTLVIPPQRTLIPDHQALTALGYPPDTLDSLS